MASERPADGSAKKTRPQDESRVSLPEKAAEPPKFSSASITSRVAASAAGLARDLVWSAGSSAGASGATSSLGESFAGSSASGSKSSLPRTSTASPAAQEAWAGTRAQNSLNGNASFREDHGPAGRDITTQDEFDRFASSNSLVQQTADARTYGATLDEDWAHSNAATQDSRLDRGQLATDWREEFLNPEGAPNKNKFKARVLSELPLTAGTVSHDVLTAQEQDGQEVVAILSDMSARNEMQDFEAEFQDSQETSADDLFGSHTVPPERVESIDRYKATLPAPPTHRLPSARDPGNLVPSLIVLDDPLEPYSREKWQQADSQWLDAWRDILERYTDDVWGPDLPAVREAREDIKSLEKRDAGGPGDVSSATALRRLRAVLGHLKLPDEELRPSNGPVVLW